MVVGDRAAACDDGVAGGGLQRLPLGDLRTDLLLGEDRVVQRAARGVEVRDVAEHERGRTAIGHLLLDVGADRLVGLLHLRPGSRGLQWYGDHSLTQQLIAQVRSREAVLLPRRLRNGAEVDALVPAHDRTALGATRTHLERAAVVADDEQAWGRDPAGA